MTTRVSKTNCLICGTILDAVSGVGADRGPKPGDPIACIRCGAIATIGDDGALRMFTEEEAESLLADDEVMDELRMVVGAIKVLKHLRN
jgi:ribosomal protein S27E